MKWPTTERLVRASAMLALAALALMCWGILRPSVAAIMVSMSVGQALGTLSLALYLIVLWRDVRRSRLLEREVHPEEDS